ncbi:hypothetical protein RZS08_24320, partial [Arthrospira platensis SPKY1]|nr:hypothetical protein [Arthrospira platensis SPKY1]
MTKILIDEAVVRQALEAIEEAEPGHAAQLLREALTEQPAQQQAYEHDNPLGGPAKVFQAMADAIRAGDSYHAVLRQYGYVEQPAPAHCEAGPEYCPECKTEAEKTAYAFGWFKALESVREPPAPAPAQEPVAWMP